MRMFRLLFAAYWTVRKQAIADRLDRRFLTPCYIAGVQFMAQDIAYPLVAPGDAGGCFDPMLFSCRAPERSASATNTPVHCPASTSDNSRLWRAVVRV